MHEVKCIVDIRKSQVVSNVFINLDFLQYEINIVLGLLLVSIKIEDPRCVGR